MDAEILEIDPAVRQTLVQNAERQALLVAAYLQHIHPLLKLDGFPSGATGFPAGYLLELGAALLLGQWEQQGLRDFLPTELPTSDQVASDLLHRAETVPLDFLKLDAAHLARRVRQVWLERFSWAAPSLLQADIVLGDADEDALVEAVAQLLWNNRHKFPG